MILRRVIEHVKHQQWTAIFIDLVIVVLGVFIGIQVSNWNTERETRQKAEVFSTRLRADLREEAWAYEYLIEYNREVLANAGRALSALSGERALSDEQFVISAYRASQYLYHLRRRDTFDELTSTGTISLISDGKLRQTASMVFATPMIEATRDGGRYSQYRELFRKSLPASVQHALLERCGDRFVPPLDYAKISKSLDYPCTLGLPEAEVRAAADALRSQELLVPTLQLRFADLETDLANLAVYGVTMRQNLRDIAARKP